MSEKETVMISETWKKLNAVRKYAESIGGVCFEYTSHHEGASFCIDTAFIDALTAERDRLKSDLSFSENKLRNYGAALEVLEAERDRLLAENANLQSMYDEALSDSMDALVAVKRLVAENAELRERVSELWHWVSFAGSLADNAVYTLSQDDPEVNEYSLLLDAISLIESAERPIKPPTDTSAE